MGLFERFRHFLMAAIGADAAMAVLHKLSHFPAKRVIAQFLKNPLGRHGVG